MFSISASSLSLMDCKSPRDLGALLFEDCWTTVVEDVVAPVTSDDERESLDEDIETNE